MTMLSGAGPVVIVDDDEIDIELLTTYFKQSDLCGHFDLVAFRGGPSFFEHMEQVEPARAPMPSIVLLDINMPRMNGFEVLERLRASTSFAELPAVVFLSNSDSPRDVERCIDLGAGFKEKFDRGADCVAFFNGLVSGDDQAPEGATA